MFPNLWEHQPWTTCYLNCKQIIFLFYFIKELKILLIPPKLNTFAITCGLLPPTLLLVGLRCIVFNGFSCHTLLANSYLTPLKQNQNNPTWKFRFPFTPFLLRLTSNKLRGPIYPMCLVPFIHL